MKQRNLRPWPPKNLIPRLAIVILAGSQLAASSQHARADTSALWGERGEKWSALSRLPDFSFAGYRSGEAPIPTPPVKASVRDFGAVGDGQADDTAAFKRALEAVQNGALLVPAGRYKITDILTIRKSNIVLRGEGPDKSVLFFPKPLEQIQPKAEATTTGLATSGYSWSGGLIWVQGSATGADLGLLQSPALRGSSSIELAAAAGGKIAVGQRVEIEQEDAGGTSLLKYLYGGQPGEVSKIPNPRIRFVSRVTAVDGARLSLQRPLPTDVLPSWKARARVFAPSVSQVGVESLGFEFPSVPYRGHFKEDGFNPLAFSGTADCWARHLRIVNADSGPFLHGRFTTVEDIVFEADRPADKGGSRGHHGFTLGNDDLLKDFDFRTRFIHDISMENGASGNVAEQGKGVDLCFDNHRRYPFANLFTDIDIGAGTRMYSAGGGDALGRHAGAWTTFWNIRARRPQKWPPADYGPDLMNIVGLESKAAPTLEQAGRWFEPIPPAQLQPANLYEAQLARRLNAKP